MVYAENPAKFMQISLSFRSESADWSKSSSASKMSNFCSELVAFSRRRRRGSNHSISFWCILSIRTFPRRFKIQHHNRIRVHVHCVCIGIFTARHWSDTGILPVFSWQIWEWGWFGLTRGISFASHWFLTDGSFAVAAGLFYSDRNLTIEIEIRPIRVFENVSFLPCHQIGHVFQVPQQIFIQRTSERYSDPLEESLNEFLQRLTHHRSARELYPQTRHPLCKYELSYRRYFESPCRKSICGRPIRGQLCI